MKKKVGCVIGMVSILFFATPSFSGMYCGRSLIMKGDSSYNVLRKCGNPARRVLIAEGIDGIGKRVEKWYYQFGEKRFIYVLTIKDDMVIRIKELSNF